VEKRDGGAWGGDGVPVFKLIDCLERRHVNMGCALGRREKVAGQIIDAEGGRGVRQ